MVKIIYMNTGMQIIGKCKIEGDYFILEDALQVVGMQDETGAIKISYNHISPYLNESVRGIDTTIHRSQGIPYDADPSIEKEYLNSVSRIVTRH